jgi:Flp pilus assembly protein TadG
MRLSDSAPIETSTRQRAAMQTLSLSDLGARASALLHRWKADAAGMAAVEFALIVPIMGVMFIGAVELSQAIIVDRRVTQIASSTADLVARAETTISQADITDIMKAGSFIMAPYTLNPLQIVIREMQSSPTSATTVKQSWTCAFNGTGSSLACSCSNLTSMVPANLVGTNDAVVVSQVTYSYKPLVFDYFMKKNYGGSSGTYILSETIYQKPRGQWPVLLQSNGTACPAPTFP